MSSKNYIRGRNFEYAVMKWLRNRGYYCMRAYGSKGLYDIIAIPPKVGHMFNYPLLIQAKTNGYVPPKEREKLEKEKWQGSVIIAYRENSRLAFKTVKGVKLILESYDILGNVRKDSR